MTLRVRIGKIGLRAGRTGSVQRHTDWGQVL